MFAEVTDLHLANNQNKKYIKYILETPYQANEISGGVQK